MCNCKLHPEVIDFIHGHDFAARAAMSGTGIFLVPAPDLGIDKRRKHYVKGISYAEMKIRSFGCLDATWCPDELKSYDAITTEGCGGACKESGDCPIGCFCNGFDPCE